MADISQWSSDERENVALDDLSLSQEQGLLWNKVMAAVRKWFDFIDRRVRRLEGAYVHKGTVETYADLPATGQQVGDVYTVASLGGENYAWTEAGWQGLGNVNANLVHRDTNETIDGTKTFLEPIVGSVTGSAGSVDAFSTAQDVTLTGDVTGTASSTAGWTVPTALAASGVTAGTYGPDADKSPAAQGSFTVPCLSVDAKGRVTAVVERSITLPADSDTTYSDFTGATSLADGAAGLVPKPLAADVDKVLGASGAWRFLSASDIASGTFDLARLPTLDAAHIPALDASKIGSGTIDIARLPAAALERLVVVADQTARYALTDQDVQLGDTVKEQDTGLMFFVVDTDELDSAAGYEPYTVGAASSVPWSGVTDKPATFPPSSHAHGNLSNDGKLSTASRVVVTDGTKAVDVSSVTATELGYLSGVTSAIQTQLDGKAATSGSISGNAGTATKLQTARSIGVSGAVVGSASFDGSANATIGTIWRHALVGQGTSTGAGRPWFKVASYAVSSPYDDIQIVFLVENTFLDSNYGILKANVRTDGNNSVETAVFKWLVNSGFDASHFVLVLPTTQNPTVEIWTYINEVWMGRRFTVLSEGNRADTLQRWTLHNTGLTDGQSATITTAGTQQASSHAELIATDLRVNSKTKSVFLGNSAYTAHMALYGGSHASIPGYFRLYADNAAGTSAFLEGRPDGTLKWNGGTIQASSDERLKTVPADVPDAVLDAWDAVQWSQFQFLDAVASKGDRARRHVGLVAQAVDRACDAQGVDICGYGILCHDQHATVPAVLDGQGNEVEPAVEAEDIWTVRYSEALAMEAAYMRRRAARAEARLAALEKRLATMEGAVHGN